MNLAVVFFFILLVVLASISIPWYSETLFQDPQDTDSTCKYSYLFAIPKSQEVAPSCVHLVHQLKSIPPLLKNKQSCKEILPNQSYLVGKYYTPSVLLLDDDLQQSFYCLQNETTQSINNNIHEFSYQVCGCAFDDLAKKEDHNAVACTLEENSSVQMITSLQFNISYSMQVWWKMEPIFIQHCHLKTSSSSKTKSKFYLHVQRSEDSPNYIVVAILCMVLIAPYLLSVPLNLFVRGLEYVAGQFLTQRAFSVQPLRKQD